MTNKWLIKDPYSSIPDYSSVSELLFNNVLLRPVLPEDFRVTTLFVPGGSLNDTIQEKKASALFHVDLVGPDVKAVQPGDFVIVNPQAMSPINAGDYFIVEDRDIVLKIPAEKLAN